MRLLLLLLLPAGGGAPAPPELTLEVSVESATVPFGRGFALTVVRSWNSELVPERWSEAELAPLEVRLEGLARHEEAGRTTETHSYRAHAFALGEVVIAPSCAARARADGARQTASCPPLVLAVTSALGPGQGAVELPRGPFPAPEAGAAWWLAVIAALLLVSVAVWWSRRRVAAAPAEPPPLPASPQARALARLERLGAPPEDPEGRRAYFVEASELLRAYLAEQFALRAPGLTTEESLEGLRRARRLAVADRELMADYLGHCDLAKFAARVPAAPRWDRSCADLQACLRRGEEAAREAG